MSSSKRNKNNNLLRWYCFSIVVLCYVANSEQCIYTNLALGSFPNNISGTCTSVSLNRNSLTELNTPVFISLVSLGMLILSENLIYNISSDGFIGIEGTLMTLDLNQNNIESVQEEFSVLSVLQTINLDYNAIANISNTAFCGTTLSELNLNHNNIEEVPILDCVNSTLTLLEVGFNRITYLHKVHLENLHNLESLVLTQNYFSYIEDGSFNSLVNLEYFLFDSGTTSNLMVMPDMSELLSNGIYWLMTDNSLPCDCSSLWLYGFVKDAANYPDVYIEMDGTPCKDELENKTFVDIHVCDICDTNTEMCCSVAPHLNNVSLVDPVGQTGYHFLNITRYACNYGYQSVYGDNALTCLQNTNTNEYYWSGDFLECERVGCGDPIIPENSAIQSTTGTLYGDSVTMICNPGYEADADWYNVTCNGDGNYEGVFPGCSAVDCGTPTLPDNAQILELSSTVYPGGWMKYICPDGYDMVVPNNGSLTGYVTVVCGNDGSWSSSLADSVICQEKSCNASLLHQNASRILPLNDSITIGYLEVAKYACEYGYEQISGDMSITCLGSNIWTGGFPYCQPVDCGEPDIPANSEISHITGTNFQNMVIFSCHHGYESVDGLDSRHCGADRHWNGSILCRVQGVDCGDPIIPENSAIESMTGTLYGDSATMICNPGYGADADWYNVTCNADGNWEGILPGCSAIDCGTPTLPDNAQILDLTSTVYPGGIATYVCLSGYDMVVQNGGSLPGYVTVFCGTDGSWSTALNDSVICQENNCNAPLIHHNASRILPVNDSITIGYLQVAKYACEYGYEQISGDMSITCLGSNMWTGDFPYCQSVACGEPDIPANSEISHITGTYFQDMVIFSCHHGYESADGLDTRHCGADRHWNGSLPCQIQKTMSTSSTAQITTEIVTAESYQVFCAEPPIITHTTSWTVIQGNSIVYYTCVEGYTLVNGVSNKTCADGSWSQNDPVCLSDFLLSDLSISTSAHGSSSAVTAHNNSALAQMGFTQSDTDVANVAIGSTLGFSFISVVLLFMVAVDFITLTKEWSRWKSNIKSIFAKSSESHTNLSDDMVKEINLNTLFDIE